MARKTLINLAASLMLAAGSSSALAQVGTAITYQGQLKESGSAVTSPTDMRFSLWDAASGGSQVGSTVEKLAIPVTEGLFTSSMDFGVGPYTSDVALYLQIKVRNPAGSGSYVPMGSRQRLTPAPFSAATRGLNVYATNRIGILADPYPTDDVALTIGRAGSQGANVLLDEQDGGFPWTLNNYGGFPYGDFTISRAGTDFPVVIKGTSSDIVLNRSSNGKVGIGTDTLTNRLSVAGNADVTGNVGFGVAEPSHRLDVADGSTIGYSTTVGGSVEAVANRGTKVQFGYEFASGCGPNTFDGMKLIVGQGSTCDHTVDIAFFTEERNVSCPREVMRINGDGNVGIGTSAPDQRLTVNGNAKCETAASNGMFRAAFANRRCIVPVSGFYE